MASRRWLATVIATGLAFAVALPVSAQRTGNKKPGGGATEIPLVIVFRDAAGDLLRSDGEGAYIAGDPGIARAAFDNAGEVRLEFESPKGKDPSPVRHFHVDLTAKPVKSWGGQPPAFLVDGVFPDFPHPPFDDLHGSFHISADDYPSGDTGSVKGLQLGLENSLPARFPIFAASKSQWRGRKLSFSDRRLFHEDFDDRVTVTCVSFDIHCIAWMVQKELDVDLETQVKPLAARVGLGGSEGKDASVWRLPFGIAVCRLDAYEGSPMDPEDPGEWCKAEVWPVSP